jgi:DNA-binding NtrC family response regulator
MNTALQDFTPYAARILVVDDDPEMCRFFEQLLGEEHYAVEVVHDGFAALQRYERDKVDLVITDLMMPRMRGTELVARLKQMDPDVLVLLVTAFGTIESAVETIRAGAFHYITKPFRTDEILLNVSRALEQRRLRTELRRLKSAVQERYRFQNIIGKSESMRKVFEIVTHISNFSANVLIMGESGTGKELIARAIHLNGIRSDKPFVPLNCAAVPETLLESELFGYVRGAFTDARKDRRGLFQEADGGVLFLDEISEVPLSVQVKLLRVLEDKVIRPLGSNQAEVVDTRIISASNRDLEQLVKEGRFRQDLYYRLNVIRIDLPRLRDRSEDIPLLVEHFITKFANQSKRALSGIRPEAVAALMNYDWPGNIRELEHTIERAVLLGKEALIGLQDLPAHLVSTAGAAAPLTEAVKKGYTLRDLEREYIRKVLENTAGNKTEAAKVLGVDRTTLYRKLEEYKLRD